MITLLLYSLVHVLEAWLEVIVIKQRDNSAANYQELNRQEHFRSAILASVWFLWAVASMVDNGAYWLILAALVNRRVFFDYTLILLRKRPIAVYEGADWWYYKLSGIFGKKGRLIELAVALLITAVSVIIYL